MYLYALQFSLAGTLTLGASHMNMMSSAWIIDLAVTAGK